MAKKGLPAGLKAYLAKKKSTMKTGTFKGKSNKLGGGGRFAQLTSKGMPPALAASIGRKKYGAKRFAKLASKK